MSLNRFIKPYYRQVFLGSFSKFLEVLLELYIPILMAKILDFGILSKDKDYIIFTGLKILGLAVIGFGFSAFCQYTASVISQTVSTNLRNELMQHISKFSFETIDQIGDRKSVV